ncbi:MAG: phosphoglycolate phosphatase [Pseudorhodoplanes sp.]
MAAPNLAPIVVFDLDGTLIDTAPDLIGTLNLIFEQEGMPAIAMDQARSLVGAGIRPLIERALTRQGRDLSVDQVDEIFERYIRHYQDHIADRSRPYPGLERALDELHGDGFVLAVCTNKYEALSLRLLDALGLTQRFAAICGQDTFPMKKPDPQTLRLTIARAGGDPARAVMVGDSETDVTLARSAAIPVIGVDFGYTPIPMVDLKPDRLLSHFETLQNAVMELVPEG